MGLHYSLVQQEEDNRNLSNSTVTMNKTILLSISAYLFIQLSSAKDVGCPFSNHVIEGAEVEVNREDEIADAETTTPNGCTCTSQCETSIGAGNFRYDWCYTNDGCGEYNFYHGYWDKCQYLCSARPDYTALTWREKQDILMENVVSDNSVGPYPDAAGLLSESVQTTFDDEWDVMPVGRMKYIHSVGAVCPFVVRISGDSPFTGIFQPGESHGLIRLGSAAPIAEGSGVTPGGGVKFLRSGQRSANFVILHTLGPIPGENYNFFNVTLRNHIPEDMPITLAPAALKFCQAQGCPTKVGLSDVCTYDQDGNRPENVVFPFKVSFVPTGDIQFQENYSELSEFMKQFTDLPAETTLYTLKGHTSPEDEDGVLLGDVVTTEKCVTSLYGDTKLFFQHQYIEDDKALKPEWEEAYDKECTPYCLFSR